MRRLLLLCGVAWAACACVSEFPAIDPASPATRGPRADLGEPDPDARIRERGPFDRGVEPDMDPELDARAEPDPAPDVDRVDMRPPTPDAAPPQPDMAPPLGPFIAFDSIASGRNFSCARRADDRRVLCWGEDNRGQLGAPVQPLSTFGLGYDHGCGYDPDGATDNLSPGAVRCWGLNDTDQAQPHTNAPVAVERISGGDRVTCGLTNVGFGCLGKPDLFRGELFALSSIAVGERHACAMRPFSERPFCWGSSDDGRRQIPQDIPLHNDSLVASRTQTCGLVRNINTIACWGPGADPPLGFYRALFASAGDHLCAINLDDETVCWGEDNRGQATPPRGVVFSALAGGAEHTCGLEPNGRVRCWGSDDVNQLQVPTP